MAGKRERAGSRPKVTVIGAGMVGGTVAQMLALRDYADIVLPACTDYEHSDALRMKNTREGTWLGIYNKVVEPPGECRSDRQFYLDLAVRMGYGADFWNGSIDAMLEEQLAPSGIGLEELRRSPRGIFVPRTGLAPEPEYRRYAKLFKGLPHGKVQCYNEFIGGKPNVDGTGVLPPLPIYQGPPEGLAETPELAKDYPLVLSDVHAYRLAQHSFFNDLAYLREREPYPWFPLPPATAREYGIARGEWEKVASPPGWSAFRAESFGGIPPEVLMPGRGWCRACAELGLPAYDLYDGGSEVNNLYNSDSRLFDKFHSQMPKQTLVKISRMEV